MADLGNIHQDENGNWFGETGYGTKVPITVHKTSFTGQPLDVEYQGDKYNDVHGNSRFESPKDEDSDK